MKRALDLFVASVMLMVLSPLLIVMSIAIWLTLGRPVFFVQDRPGHGGRIFRIYKFRSMREARDSNGDLRPDAERITRLGRFLRASSLDEMPELLNVLRGDMSLVGPRPLRVEYLDLYSPEQRRRHEVRPGITGWAQIHGRNALSWEERFEHDVWYVDHRTLGLDLKILAVTALKVLRGEGISAPSHATMPAFTGSIRRESTERDPVE